MRAPVESYGHLNGMDCHAILSPALGQTQKILWANTSGGRWVGIA